MSYLWGTLESKLHLLCLHSKVSIFVIVIFTIYESKECRYVRHIRHFILLLRATDLMHIFHWLFSYIRGHPKYWVTSKKSKVKSKKSNVICVNCQTSWLDPGTNLCSYCGLDLLHCSKDSPKAICKLENLNLIIKNIQLLA